MYYENTKLVEIPKSINLQLDLAQNRIQATWSFLSFPSCSW